MTIEINDKLVGLWMANIANGDILAALHHEETESVLTWRFRHYVDEHAWGSKDTKSWYAVKAPHEREQDLIKHARFMFLDMTQKVFNKGAWEIMRDGRTTKEMGDALMTMPGMHARQVTEEEFKSGYHDRMTQ